MKIKLKKKGKKAIKKTVSNDINIKLVQISDIETNDYNPNVMEKETFDLLVDHIQDDGHMVQPVLVRENPTGKTPYMLVDGEHRFSASAKAGLKDIMVVVVPYDEVTAKIRTISMNSLRGNYVPMKMANLLHELQKKYSKSELHRMTGIHEDEMESLATLLEVPDIDFSDSPTISSSDVERPIAVNIMLMPDEHSAYTDAMVKAMELAGPVVVPLVAEEVGQYDKAMNASMGLSGAKLRNVGLATICKVFNKLSKADKKKLVAQVSEVKEN